MRFSRILMFPILSFVLIGAYIILKNDWIYYSGYVGAGIILLVLVFIFAPQIDFWWWERFTPSLPKRISALFLQCKPEYSNLSPPERALFDKRLFLYLQGKDFEFMDLDTEPEDVKALAGYYAILLTFHQSKFLLDPFDKIVYFKDRFGSPAQKTPHVSEINFEDGVFIFSIRQLALGFKDPAEAFDIGLYEYFRVYCHLHPEVKCIADTKRLEALDLWFPEKLQMIYKYESVDESALTMVNFYSFPKVFSSHFPEENAFLSSRFKHIIR